MYDKSNPETIQKMFASIAKRYDRTNAVLSLGLHRFWNRALVRRVVSDKIDNWLDLCSGTGDIAFEYLSCAGSQKKATLIDFCPEMLACAKDKAGKLLRWHTISFVQADVQNLPLENQSASVATMAYGIRNVKNTQQCFHEVYRVLRPGGMFGILELTQPTNPFIRWAHGIYLKRILPLLGKCLTDNREAYSYLCNSIQNFTPPADLEQMLLKAGFARTTIHPLTFGTATILIGYKA
ncbi:MAG: bifunctional demethylmenaquinone methyltransferase/2-methoxy-6-polyprenyl-1,4-benzoquinol methylase UbiE [Parachlamydia sp.]|nr:bifunctional demethylmenaquinone methyltransferase/2-methoxy-6-polyprenyl-1,4-benzoquinol methylase UbiE [Parachlamydia sp.]